MCIYTLVVFMTFVRAITLLRGLNRSFRGGGVGWGGVVRYLSLPQYENKTNKTNHFCVFTLKSRYKLPKLTLRFNSSSLMFQSIYRTVTHVIPLVAGPVLCAVFLQSPPCVLEDLKRQLKASRYAFVFTLHPPSIPSPRFSER